MKAHLARWSRATGQALGQPSGLGEDSGLRHGDQTYCLTHCKTSNAEEEEEEAKFQCYAIFGCC